MAYKMVALDLDETTLNEHGVLTPYTREVLQRVIEAGLCVVVASGRSWTSLPEEIRAFPGIRYAIVSNGAAIYEKETGTCLRRLRLTARASQAILSLVPTLDHIIVEVGIDGQIYAPAPYVEDPVAFRHTPHIVEYVQTTRVPVQDILEFFRMHMEEVECVDIICENPDDKPQVADRVRQEVPDVYVTSSIPSMVELAHPEAGKGHALAYLAAREHIDSANIFACGNADNDIDMVRYAGCGVAVENATAGCLAAADYVTDAHQRDGVAKALDAYVLSNI